ncbi:hypothetical protein DL546_004040 [Coniochaeta pulveracea]|uniref:AB hydrolase-1 domain-containing protein n=1 Tax=Coniochaeta pulveracea TaxID=177199 RepID=A0A420XZB3_9PEZI|nr:hypothetical protein DL546_004040 [Coniochaeta pulveracea]
MVSNRKTESVPHLGGVEVGYRLSSLDPSRPTLVLIIPFTTTVDYYLPEFENPELTDKLNLLAVEPLGHGATRAKTETFTYWDSALVFLQLMDNLGIDKAFAAGTSQGGLMAARMALLAPQRIQGIIPIGSSMDSESSESRALGCWDGPAAAAGLVDLHGDLSPKPDFEPGDGYRDFLLDIGYGKGVTTELVQKWGQSLQETYSGDEGKRRICAAAVCLTTRDGLHKRLPQIRCPGTGDVVFSFANAEAEIKLFTNSPEAKLVKMDDGVHFLSFTHQKEVHQNLLDFTKKWAGK